MSNQRTFYTEMVNAIKATGGECDISAEVWNEFCAKSVKTTKTVLPSAVITEHSASSSAAMMEINSNNGSMDLSWNELELKATNCKRCALRNGCKQVVFGEGNKNAELMFVGEAPGAEEDMQGRPIVGAAGELLDKMIVAMRYRREDVYIANIVKCRPPGNRTPEKVEADMCMPYLDRQIELIKPKAIILLGATPLRLITGNERIKKHRGIWCSYRGIQVMPTFHPAYLLRAPEDKRLAWNDLKLVMALLGKKL